MENNDPSSFIDESLLPFAQMVEQLSNLEGKIGTKEMGVAMEIEEAELALPLQMEILVDQFGQVTLGASPPLYYVETSVMPVFQNIHIKLKKENTSDAIGKYPQQQQGMEP